MATHSSILAPEIPWMEEPGGLQFMGSQSEMTEQLHFHGLSCSGTYGIFLDQGSNPCLQADS